MMTDADIEALTDEELADHVIRMQAQQDLRAAIARADENLDSSNRAILAQGGVEPETEWVQPTKPAQAFPRGWRALKNGKLYVSTEAGNMGTPGVDPTWTEIISGIFPPWSSGVTYARQDIVTHADQAWVSTVNSNTDTPGGASSNPWVATWIPFMNL